MRFTSNATRKGYWSRVLVSWFLSLGWEDSPLTSPSTPTTTLIFVDNHAQHDSVKQKEAKNDKWHRVERSSGKFIKRFRLPENAKIDQVKAVMENGLLTVTVCKEEKRRKTSPCPRHLQSAK
ncbi:hypothetical protein FF1_011425 [Malus domestica]